MSFSAARRLGLRLSDRSSAWRTLVLPLGPVAGRSATPPRASTSRPPRAYKRADGSAFATSLVDERRRSFHSGCRRCAEEASTLPLETDIMNLLDKNPEFREATMAFAARMKDLLGLDIANGQMPGPKDMLALAGDSELRTLATRVMTILTESNINISEDSVRQIYGMLMSGQLKR